MHHRFIVTPILTWSEANIYECCLGSFLEGNKTFLAFAKFFNETAAAATPIDLLRYAQPLPFSNPCHVNRA